MRKKNDDEGQKLVTHNLPGTVHDVPRDLVKEEKALELRAKKIKNLKPIKKGEVRNKGGKNQYTVAKRFEKFREEAALVALADLNKIVPDALDVIIHIMKNGERETVRLKAAEIVLNYTMGPPVQRHANADGSNIATNTGVNAIILLPQEKLLDESNIIEMSEIDEDGITQEE